SFRGWNNWYLSERDRTDPDAEPAAHAGKTDQGAHVEVAPLHRLLPGGDLQPAVHSPPVRDPEVPESAVKETEDERKVPEMGVRGLLPGGDPISCHRTSDGVRPAEPEGYPGRGARALPLLPHPLHSDSPGGGDHC